MPPAAPEPPRSTYLGGSDAPAVLGVSPWRSRYRLWCEKVGIEQPPDISSKDYVYFGTLLEPVVARVFAERTDHKVRVARKLFVHPEHQFIAGHIDRDVLNEDAFLECKTANAFDYTHWGASEMGAAGVPEHYLAQVDHYMLLRDCTHCYVAALIGGNDFRWYRIERDPKREQRLLAAEIEFWGRVTANDPPDVDNEKDARHRWATSLQGTAAPVGGAERKMVVRLAQVQAQMKELEREEEKLRDALVPLFEDREYISESGTALARLTTYTRKYFDVGEFEKNYPALRDEFTEIRTSKRLRILI